MRAPLAEGQMGIVSIARKAVAAFAMLGLIAMTTGCAHRGDDMNAALAEQQLRSLHEQWGVARIAGDVAFLERFYGQELRLQVMNGSVVSRAQDIALFDRVGRRDAEVIRPEYIHDDDMTVSVYGETAVVTGVEHLRGTARGVYGEMALRFTNVLVYRDGRWQLVLHHSTPVQSAQ